MPLDRLLLETDAPYFVPRRIPRSALVSMSNPGMALFTASSIANLRVRQGRAEKIRAPPQPLGPGGPGPLANGLGGLGPLVNGVGGPGPFSLQPQGLRGPLAYGFRGPGPLEYG